MVAVLALVVSAFAAVVLQRAVQPGAAVASQAANPGGNVIALPPTLATAALDAALAKRLRTGSAPATDVGLDERPNNTSCLAPARPPETSAVALTRAISIGGYPPLGIAQAPNDAAKWYVVNRAGTVTRLQRTGSSFASMGTFVDLRDRVLGGGVTFVGEAGLLSVTFSPKFAQNGQVFVYYSAVGTEGTPFEARVSRFISRDDGLTLDKTSEQVVLRVPRTDTNNIHWGGGPLFGPDGLMYIALGDAQIWRESQDLGSLFGKMLRIDVGVESGYSVPSTNPFVGVAGARPEIWARGLRNPWSWSFDRETGEIWLGDVGNTRIEEVNKVVKGGNYGWAVLEGNGCTGLFPCNTSGMTAPEYSYGRFPSPRGNAVIGGYVYHGTAIPTLRGKYVFADVSGKIFALQYDALGNPTGPELGQATGAVFAFAQDPGGEILVAGEGGLFWIAPAGAPPPSTFPDRLSVTGCMDAAKPWLPGPGLIPYNVNSPLWSDGAEKERWFAVPNGTNVRIGANGDWDLPIGAVTVKTFRVGGKLVETRLMVRHDDGEWAGYSYEWNDAQTDAVLLPAGKVKPVGSQVWTFPSRSQCLGCHTDVAGRTLGLESGQLNRTMPYPQTGRTANQLVTLSGIGVFEYPLIGTPANWPRLPTPTGTADPVDQRARSYLHANCAMCHQPGGPGRGPEDFRFSTPIDQMGALYVFPTQSSFGIPDARLLYPGRPQQSIISYRMHTTDEGRMPPIGRSLMDVQGVGVIDSWITSGLGMGVGDRDNDGFADNVDNCKSTSNPTQRDSDGDGIGNMCDADFTNDGLVNAADLALFQLAFGSRASDATFNPNVDMNGDGRINSQDLALFQVRFGKPAGDR